MEFLKKYSNSIGDIVGNENTIIQIIDKNGHPITANLGKLLEQILEEDNKEVVQLKKIITDKEKISGYQDKELFELKTKLVEKNKVLEDREKQLAKVYLELNGKDLAETPKLYAKAYVYFLDGDIKKALSTLDRQKMIEEKDKLISKNKEHAEAWMFKARLFQSEQDYERAEECFDFAIELHSSWGNCLDAANYFYYINKFKKTERLLFLCFSKAANVTEQAITLNNLAILQKAKNEFNKAEKNCREALDIYRNLAKVNSEILPDVASTLNNLAELQKAKNEFDKAEKNCLEALGIYKQFNKIDSQTYLHDIGMIFNNLAILQNAKNEFDKSENSYNEALSIYKNLANINPQAYLPYMAGVFHNLAALNGKKNEFDKAKENCIEALEIRRKLAKVNPQTYLPDVASTLNNLGLFQSAKNEFDKSENSYNEALEIRRKLVKITPQTYLPVVASTLYNLANLQRDKRKFNQSEKNYSEALEIQRQLFRVNPPNYLLDLVSTLINLSVFYLSCKIDNQLSFQLADEAITKLMPFSETSFIQNYLEKAFIILYELGVDIEEYLKEKALDNGLEKSPPF